MATITRRYLHVNGPATRDDYARWFAISPAQAGKHIAALGDDVAEVHVDGAPMWMLAADVKAATTCQPARAVRLLPAFDQYVVASTRQADDLLPGKAAGPRLPSPGLAVPRRARRRPDGRRLEARTQGHPPHRRPSSPSPSCRSGPSRRPRTRPEPLGEFLGADTGRVLELTGQGAGVAFRHRRQVQTSTIQKIHTALSQTNDLPAAGLRGTRPGGAASRPRRRSDRTPRTGRTGRRSTCRPPPLRSGRTGPGP